MARSTSDGPPRQRECSDCGQQIRWAWFPKEGARAGRQYMPVDSTVQTLWVTVDNDGKPSSQHSQVTKATCYRPHQCSGRQAAPSQGSQEQDTSPPRAAERPPDAEWKARAVLADRVAATGITLRQLDQWRAQQGRDLWAMLTLQQQLAVVNWLEDPKNSARVHHELGLDHR